MQNGKTKDVPLLLWLEGGPGGSFIVDVFMQNGPLHLNKDMSVSLQNHSWNQEFALLFFDNPVGVGFSFTDHENGMP